MSTPKPQDAQDVDVSRRTWLAAERTWLAWWRTGLASAAVGMAVARLLPVQRKAHWPFALLGVGYGLLAVAVLLVGAARQRRNDAALRGSGFDHLSGGMVLGLTWVAVALSLITVVLAAFDS